MGKTVGVRTKTSVNAPGGKAGMGKCKLSGGAFLYRGILIKPSVRSDKRSTEIRNAMLEIATRMSSLGG